MYFLKKNILLVIVIFFMIITSFFVSFDADKFVGLFIICLCLYIAFFLERIKLYKEKRILYLSIIFLITTYLYQLFYYGIFFNKNVIEIFVYICLIHLFDFKVKHWNNKNFLILYGVLFLVFNLLTLREGGYSVITGSGKILGAYLLLLAIFIFDFFKKPGFAFMMYVSAILVLLIQVRMPILCAVLYFLLRRKLKLKVILKIVFAFLIIAIPFIYFFKDTRVFQTHSSGRYYVWLKVLNSFKFDFNHILFGMGSGEGTNYLLNVLNLGKTMGAMHNAYLKYFYNLGVLGGLLPILSILLYVFLKSERLGKLLVVIYSLQLFTDNVFTYFFNYSMIYFILISFYFKSKKEKGYV